VSASFDFGDLFGEVAAAYRTAGLEAEVRRAADPAAAERTLHWGRNYLYTSRWATAQGPVEVVVKQFRDSSLRARWRRRRGESKARRSFRAARALADAGIGTAEPVAAIESRRRGGPSFYVSLFTAHDFELRYFLRALNAGRAAEVYPGVEAAALVAAVGRLARRLHEAGIWHRDFTSGNILVRAAAAGEPRVVLLDLNRARLGRRPGLVARLRELARMPIRRRPDQEIYLEAYFGRPPRPSERRLFRAAQRGFLLKNEWKAGLRRSTAGLRGWVLPRSAHAHIPPPPGGAGARDKIVWDPLSDQPHQHAGRLEKLRVRLADAPAHVAEAWAVGTALPRIVRRFRELQGELDRRPVPWGGLGIAVRPWPRDPAALIAELEALGARRVLLRLHPWEDDHGAEEELARELHRRGYELAFALPQNRELVRDLGRWRGKVEELGSRFAPFGRQFQIGQAINRSKWGIWNLSEYAALADVACEELRRRSGLELLGPAVIDFEFYRTAAALNLRRGSYEFDIVSALLYVDRRGAPENRQAGLDTAGKTLLLKAIADTARRAKGRAWVTEVNWPLWEGPHSPAGRSVAVDEERQADYLVRYFLLALSTGAVERVYWWQLIARGYGLVDPQEDGRLRRRPAFWAMATLARGLDGATHLRPLPAPEGARLHLFRRAGGEELVVGWATRERAAARLPRRAAALVGRDGEELPAPATEAVELSPSPRYFRLSP